MQLGFKYMGCICLQMIRAIVASQVIEYEVGPSIHISIIDFLDLAGNTPVPGSAN